MTRILIRQNPTNLAYPWLVEIVSDDASDRLVVARKPSHETADRFAFRLEQIICGDG